MWGPSQSCAVAPGVVTQTCATAPLASIMYCFVLWGGGRADLRDSPGSGNACWQCLLAVPAGSASRRLAARRLGSLAVFRFVFGFRVRVSVFGERVFGLVFVCFGVAVRG